MLDDDERSAGLRCRHSGPSLAGAAASRRRTSGSRARLREAAEEAARARGAAASRQRTSSGRSGSRWPPGIRRAPRSCARLVRCAGGAVLLRPGRHDRLRRHGPGLPGAGSLAHGRLQDQRSRRGARSAELAEAYALQGQVYCLAALRAGAPAVQMDLLFLERPREPVTRAAMTPEDSRAAGESGWTKLWAVCGRRLPRASGERAAAVARSAEVCRSMARSLVDGIE